jgi:heme-degrading monooxygenase HmoA
MISRHWRGLAKREEADNYIRHLEDETFPQLARLAGFISATVLRRPVPQGTEFLIVTTWESIDAIGSLRASRWRRPWCRTNSRAHNRP